MADLIQAVKDGKVVPTANSTTGNKINNDLDKNAFLKLLTTQMKYQDPLNPNTDTEYIAQLATFSQLEQLQNLSSVTTNSVAFNLVGKEVVIKTENSTGNTTYINGRVDFVTMTGNTTKLSINGSLYSIDQLDSVIADEFIFEQNLPGIEQATELTYDAAIPKDISFDVKLGSGDTIADDVMVVINNQVIDKNYVSLSGSKVVIKQDAFKELGNGVYKLAITFNDPMLTTIRDKITLKVTNARADDNAEQQSTE